MKGHTPRMDKPSNRIALPFSPPQETKVMSNAIQAYVFDAYGTLFDVNSPVQTHSSVLGDNARVLATLWRDKQLQYTWLRSLQERFVDFEQVTADALDYAMAHIRLTNMDLRASLLEAYARPVAYPEVRRVLETLRARGMSTAILSNGTRGWLASAIEANGLEGLFDTVLSVDAVQIFKPHPSVYRLAEQALELPTEKISFQSSNGWDAFSASAYGMRVVWCNRSQQPPECLPEPPQFTVSTLDGLLEIPPLAK